jgi:hypothetical protein
MKPKGESMTTKAKKPRCLTAKEETFAQHVVDGLTRSDAWRVAYPASAAKAKTVWEEASRLLAKPHVAARVEQLRAELGERHMWTRVQAIRTLLQVIDEPESQTAVLRAVRELNEMHGFHAPQKISPVDADGRPVPLLHVSVVYDA